jgi:hypothetical protein
MKRYRQTHKANSVKYDKMKKKKDREQAKKKFEEEKTIE